MNKVSFHIKDLEWIVTSVLLTIFFTGCTSFGPVAGGPEKENQMSQPVDFDHMHSVFNNLLALHVKDGWVDYSGFSTDSKVLSGYTNMLGSMSESALDSWSCEQKLAFWINAYNAFTIEAIIERYPIRERSLIGLSSPRNSILQISGIWSRLTFQAGGKKLTLGSIEHEILRKEFNEPRIHFAIVCASRSCPKLRDEAYRHDMLDDQLEKQTADFINDPYRGGRWDETSNRLYISKIFKWFKDDFTSHGASESGNPLLVYLRPYITNASIQEAILREDKIEVAYLPYDWRLNEKNLSNTLGGTDD